MSNNFDDWIQLPVDYALREQDWYEWITPSTLTPLGIFKPDGDAIQAIREAKAERAHSEANKHIRRFN